MSSLGELFTWGTGKYGRLGHGTQDDQLAPKQVRCSHLARCLPYTLQRYSSCPKCSVLYTCSQIRAFASVIVESILLYRLEYKYHDTVLYMYNSFQVILREKVKFTRKFRLEQYCTLVDH